MNGEHYESRVTFWLVELIRAHTHTHTHKAARKNTNFLVGGLCFQISCRYRVPAKIVTKNNTINN